MARKTKLVEVDGDPVTNRDAGKVFLLTEMAAGPAEKWAMRAFLALARAKVDVAPEIASLGLIGVWLISFQALQNASWHDAEPLMDEMFTCVRVCPNKDDRGVTRPLIETDIEEVKTQVRLRRELMELHAGFTFADLLWMLQNRSATAETTSGPQTSPS
jgi:hypothetical protein